MACSLCDIASDIKTINSELAEIQKNIKEIAELVKGSNPTKQRNRVIISDDESDSDTDFIERPQSVTSVESKDEPEPPLLYASPHSHIMGTIRFHELDGPYIIGDPLALESMVDFDVSTNHFIRWLVSAKDVKIKKKSSLNLDLCQTYFFCDWSSQVVDVDCPNQLDCIYEWDRYTTITPKRNGTSSSFFVSPMFYSYGSNRLYDFRELKNIFMKKIESSDDIFEKRSECLDTLEKAMGERLFKFGTDSNIHASEEIKDWAIYHPSPTLCLNNEELKNGKMDICMACNLRRKITSHWESGSEMSMTFGSDCALRVRGLFKIFSRIPNELYKTPSERQFNLFIFEIIEVLDSFNGLQMTKNKKRKR